MHIFPLLTGLERVEHLHKGRRHEVSPSWSWEIYEKSRKLKWNFPFQYKNHYFPLKTEDNTPFFVYDAVRFESKTVFIVLRKLRLCR